MTTERLYRREFPRLFNPTASCLSLVNTRKGARNTTPHFQTPTRDDDAGQQTPKWEAVSTIVCFWVKLAACAK
jgi:hypothetical protein